jgi:hypothetical protein
MNRTDGYNTPRWPDHDLDEGVAPDVAEIAGALDELCARERMLVPAGLAGRIYRASLPSLLAPTADGPVHPTGPVGRISPARQSAGPRRALAMAAAVALLATVGAAWLAGDLPVRTAGGSAIADADLDAWLASPELLDVALGESIDEVSAAADEVARAVGESWMPDDLIYSDEAAGESL